MFLTGNLEKVGCKEMLTKLLTLELEQKHADNLLPLVASWFYFACPTREPGTQSAHIAGIDARASAVTMEKKKP